MLSTLSAMMTCILLLVVSSCSVSYVRETDNERIAHIGYAIVTSLQGKKVSQSNLGVWICDKPDFLIEFQVTSDSKKICYYNGERLITGVKDDQESVLSEVCSYDLRHADKSRDWHQIAFFYSTMIVPSIVDPLSSSKLFRYSRDMAKVLDVTSIESTEQRRIYKSKELVMEFSKADGILRDLRYQKEGKSVHVMWGGENDVTGFNRQIILRYGMQHFGLTKDNSERRLKMFMQKTDDIVTFGNVLYFKK